MKSRRKTHSLPKIPLALGVMALVLAAIAIFFPRATPLSINEVGSASGTTTLTFSPATVTTAPNTETTLTLHIDTGGSNVTAAVVELTYDPAKLAAPVVTQGDFLTNVISAAKVENGKIKFTYSTPVDVQGKSGSGTLATIKIKPTVAGNASLDFTEGTAVAAIGAESSVLKSAANVTISASEETASTEPSTEPSTPAITAASKPTVATGCSGATPTATVSWTGGTDTDGYTLNIFDFPFNGDYYNKEVGKVHSANVAGMTGTADSPNVNGKTFTLTTGKKYAVNIWNGVVSPDSDAFTAPACTVNPSDPPSAPSFTQNCQSGIAHFYLSWTGSAGQNGFTVYVSPDADHDPSYSKQIPSGATSNLNDLSGSKGTFNPTPGNYHAWVSNGKESGDTGFTIRDCNAATPSPSPSPSQKASAKPSVKPSAKASPKSSSVASAPQPFWQPGSPSPAPDFTLPSFEPEATASPAPQTIFEAITSWWQGVLHTFTSLFK